jgi:two-component system, OmpR family, sensor histidine kinase ChvG
MALVTDSLKSDALARLRWSGRISLSWRILAINIFALALLAGGFFYIDGYRTRVLDSALNIAGSDLALVSIALSNAPASKQGDILTSYSLQVKRRVRMYDAKGQLVYDSFRDGGWRFTLVDPDKEPLKRHVARFLDKVIDGIVDAHIIPPYTEPQSDTAQSWPEVGAAVAGGPAQTRARYVPDRTPMISAAIRLKDGSSLLSSENALDITRIVRAERFNLAVVLATAILACVLLSFFLARTIVRPLQRLANASVRVRLGRARQVTIPRLPDRRDEIGTLARAISDMTQALRHRIDATDAFAADVSHELKNPIASLRSALDGMETVEQPELRAQLFAIAKEDVLRLDRLVTEIAEASRIDAQLSRARFEPVDMGHMIENMILARESRGLENGVRLAFARPRKNVAVVMGEPQRLALVIENLLANAISFSPPAGLVQVTATVVNDEVLVSVEDDGPGVPPEEREMVFRRFHSVRPEGESFGKHSGLGLAIARSIVDGHQGHITIDDRDDDQVGARFNVYLPLAHLGDPGISAE